ncbi:xanthine dehydrogenase family protein molybdopterin-binding subunit [Methylophaga thiooxydans]|uniref:Aldehyde oxidase and xanthine dehydrogenase, molybdopterin binding domain protein n=1 Tax=Methylophaga thiooxydans DMS010 TaxID=637616 RepID=C0N267_9GAMM|nr:xanthine dehydrogenase family protein molybdopterin-binding subunit [Methylophaga thiooxydans]EEF81312.1 Aldehyde oxidase and xanthine dehydrogenase, molybdopterin binding domain protein [Methylophaga thiooxydans DMS010]
MKDKIANISRRNFVKGFALSGLVLAVGLPGLSTAAEAKQYGRDGMPHGWVDNPLVFVSIAEDGTVTIVAHRSEMGQGVRTSLPMVVADEMEADWAQVKVVQAYGDEEKFGNQDTDGSRSVRHFFMPMRNVGAAARMMLETAAAALWSVPVSEVKAMNHKVVHEASGRSVGFGELAQSASKLPVPERESLIYKDASDFRYIGKSDMKLADGEVIATGQTEYGMDIRLENMVYAVVAHPPAYGDTLASYDDKETLNVPGVIKTLTLPSSAPPAVFNPLGGVVVVAENTWAAIQGREKLKIEWKAGPNSDYESAAFREKMQTSANQKGGKVLRQLGDSYQVLEDAEATISADYYIPHLAQAPMEPPVATAYFKGDSCELWAPTQAPQASRDTVAKWLELKPEQVKVNVTLLGGGFGRKSKPDFLVEAALTSKALGGKPVKLVWTREDDIQHSYFHTVSYEHLQAAFDENGKTQAWLHRTVAPSIASTFDASSVHQMPIEIGMGVVNIPFSIPNIQLENPAAENHTRIGWFRSVSNIPHAFAVQSFISEMAHQQNRDHKALLLELIGDDREIDPRMLRDEWNYGESPEQYPLNTGRLRRVIEHVTETANWGKSLPEGQGQGLAAHYSFVTYVAAVVEVKVSDDGEVSVPKVDISVDCGPQVNPERIRSQVEGACIMGISLAMLGEISFKDGVAVQNNFDGYQVSRMNEAPAEINVHLMPANSYDDPLGGVGEPGMPPIAPALCNAIFAATKKRIRNLPIRYQLEA